jgi:histidine ammonia-lyase
MIPQYAAASIVSENKVLVHPASADSIPTCENTEDHVSMGTIAARQAMQICDNVEKVLAIAILTGYYALSMRLSQFESAGMDSLPEERLSKATLEFYNAIKEVDKELKSPEFQRKDRFLSPEIKIIARNISVFEGIAERYLGVME